jgi:hypothetical protein
MPDSFFTPSAKDQSDRFDNNNRVRKAQPNFKANGGEVVYDIIQPQAQQIDDQHSCIFFLPELERSRRFQFFTEQDLILRSMP